LREVPETVTPTSEREILSVDDLDFEVRRSARRRTLELTIDRGGELRISAPVQLDRRVMREFVRQRKVWIYTKLAWKSDRLASAQQTELEVRDSFAYLGRKHSLVLVDSQERPLVLDHGRFRLRTAEVAHAREHFVDWYTARARNWLERNVFSWAARLGVEPTGVRVLDLGHRWGSCGKAGTLNFHWKAIVLPPRIVEYVMVHELVHLREPNHTPAFWRGVESALPDYVQRKDWLGLNGAAAI
jgi:predicted metal-dependent hydrolase